MKSLQVPTLIMPSFPRLQNFHIFSFLGSSATALLGTRADHQLLSIAQVVDKRAG